ncbi:hypothetical protein E2F43_06510 [Seongchinamella unica]|uniref:Uncharacterized protein n=1 Tax=Seongchinamella unica TaxID=2547392 RepID=A0A4R5LWM2_9GAMM|nr:hypothetical protein [Seongchinamella unica]TDG15873.1 hypothetical protein E2F43_06510 [Seongchinamella unica]
MPQRILASLLLLASTITLAQDTVQFPGVEGLMSTQEYQDAGLHKLSDAEREALDQWLIRYTAWQAPQIRKSVEEVKEVEKAFELTASIKQPFKGWSDSTYFYLDNGQVWQQRNAARYYYSGEDTRVRISKNALGFYVMEHLATGKKIGVKQVR